MSYFDGRVAVITGGASGIGRALAHALAREGARLWLLDLDEAGAQAVAGPLEAKARRLDVTDGAAVDAAVNEVVATEGRVDFMFNNAGIAVGGAVEEQALEDWRSVIEVNLMGVVHGVHAVWPHMVRQGSGHVVNTASLAGLIPVPGATPYATTKHAVVGLSRSLRAEGMHHGIRVTALCPGFIDTAILDSPVRGEGAPALRKTLRRLKLVQPDDFAQLTLRALARNQAHVVTPTYAHVLWRAIRLMPETAIRSAAKGMIRPRGPGKGGGTPDQE